VGHEERSSIGSDQIQRRKFASVRRGFDPEKVDVYLEQLAAQVEVSERSTET